MIEIKITEKQKYLDENYPFNGTPKLTDKRYCLHCEEIITVGDYKIFKDEFNDEYICCPNAPDCDGTVIDWISI